MRCRSPNRIKTTVESAVNNPFVLLVEDTDLLILLFFHFDLDSNERNFKSMSTSSTTMKIWDIRKTKSTLGLDACHVLPFVHAISGCDTTSRMFGIEKSTLFKRF
jgi:hypothetical protein